jgi:hypothetical protein
MLFVDGNFKWLMNGDNCRFDTNPRFAHSPTHPNPWCALVNESKDLIVRTHLYAKVVLSE